MKKSKGQCSMILCFADNNNMNRLMTNTQGQDTKTSGIQPIFILPYSSKYNPQVHQGKLAQVYKHNESKSNHNRGDRLVIVTNVSEV